MPKKSIEINPFDGGLNDFADARDIKENELAAATNIKTDQPGRIKIGKRIHTVSERESEDAVISIGSGLFHYNSDFNASHAAGNTEYQIMYQASSLYRRDVGTTDFGTAILDGSAYDPCFFSLDGNVRISDGAHASDTKFIGVTDVNYFNQAEANQFTVKDAYIDAPTAGSLTKDPATPANAVTVNNALALIVQQKTGSKDDWFSFNKDDDDNTALASVDAIYNQYGYLNQSQNDDYIQNDTEYDGNNFSFIMTSDGGITDNGSTNTDTMLKINKTNSSIDYNRMTMKFSEDKSFEEKSVFIDVYMTSYVKNNLKANAIKVRIGNNIQGTGTSGNECFVYEIGSDQIQADAWTTLEFVQGQHDEVEGTPNASGLRAFQFIVEYLSDDNSNAGSNDKCSFYLDNLQVGESSRGLWNGKYKFFQSWIYDKTQESNTYEYSGQGSTYEVEDKILQFRIHGLESANIGTNNRITGANIYYVEYDIDNNPLDTDKKLLMEVDLERGIKKVGGETWEAWGDANGSNTGYEAPTNANNTAYLQIMDPPVLETFSTKAGYDEEDKLKKMKYKTAVTMNRRSYVGNVQVTDSADKVTVYSDRVYKSEPNMPDIYTENGYVDVAINDGESVTALASFGDILLQFKERTLYLINCTQEIEYLEDTSKFRGVWGQGAVCETDEGIVWVNKYGLFLFNGKEIIPLIDNKIDPENWNAIIGTKPLVGYAPLDRSVLVVGDADNASKGYTFSIRAEGFTHITGASGGNLFADDMTNLVSSNAGVLSWYDASGSTDHVTEKKWDNAIGDVYIDIKTRDQDFKDPARRKMVKNIYLTYKVPDDGTVPAIKYRTDGGTTDYDFNSALLSADSVAVDWNTIVLKPNTSSQANNVYSLQVRMYGDTDKDFEINDINVVYRDKVLK